MAAVRAASAQLRGDGSVRVLVEVRFDRKLEALGPQAWKKPQAELVALARTVNPRWLRAMQTAPVVGMTVPMAALEMLAKTGLVESVEHTRPVVLD